MHECKNLSIHVYNVLGDSRDQPRSCYSRNHKSILFVSVYSVISDFSGIKRKR
ncbi:unnamed protein product, partial [Arabidopsis halleri]